MKEKYCKIPKFRFNKFLESWERLKYEDVIEVNSGKDYKHLDKGDIPVYGTGGYMLSVSEAITDKDGVGIGRKGTINKPYILKAPYWTVDTLFFCIPKNKYNLYFINAIFERAQWERFDESTGVPSLSKLTINNIQNYFPSFNEQSAIGSLFRTLDDLLASYKDNLANYQSLKATMLSKMFPKAGQTVPEIRLEGFDGEWERKSLSEVCTINSGRDYKHLKDGDIPVYGTGGYMLSVNEKLSDEDAIGIGRKGTIDKPYLLSGPFWTVDTLFYVTCKVGYDLNYLFLVFQKVRWKKFDESTGVPSLSKKTIEKVVSKFPSLPEQQAIGSYFSNLDNLINSHQEKISQLETLKKKLLQDMFI